MRAEVEAKFAADDPSVLAALAHEPSLGPATLGPSRTVPETDRYLDTPDGALATERWACRLRERDGAIRVSLKGPAEVTAGEWHHRHPEVEGPATGSIRPTDWPDSEARRRLVELAGDAGLVERFVLRQNRTERPVVLDGLPVAILSLDEVTIVAGERELGRLHVVELELANAESLPPDRFEELANALAARPGLRPEPRSKLEHAIELLDAR
jgi:inorganic triphosphatase YgiF